ncbi:hypothetical protein CCHOA_02735 [Corynebacterium choanae]|uniref:Uncharacterized protein n=1 Tax=Corynebacterium choanae TaxID=1862358 RepID=A0A3G6J5C9_9CORY|nr:hypothetical protein CCHOA_02735 [Corynebacterium choanae]
MMGFSFSFNYLAAGTDTQGVTQHRPACRRIANSTGVSGAGLCVFLACAHHCLVAVVISGVRGDNSRI